MSDDKMWDHKCPVEGEISIGKGEPCSWCGATEPKSHLTLVVDNEIKTGLND